MTKYQISFLPIVLLLFAFILPSGAYAQDDGGFTADRPGATTGPDVLPRGRVQWETGASWELSRMESPGITTWTVNSSMLRWGFSDFAELRIQGDYLISVSGGDTARGFDNLTIGTKAKLYEGDGILPTMSLLANVLVSGGHRSEFLPRHAGANMGLLFSNELAPWCSLGYEADLIWAGEGHPTVFFGLGLGFSLSERLSLQVEEFNYSHTGTMECWSELSLAYQLSKRVQLDLGSDISLNTPGKYHNLMLGFSWQLK